LDELNYLVFFSTASVLPPPPLLYELPPADADFLLSVLVDLYAVDSFVVWDGCGCTMFFTLLM
jgi:hypothetical protein